ncbi:hypothetical protein [Chryseobacterium sp. G0201]|uniref:hypothetical protein n=1 Tax=Chryseobacterium sp. G0201 TaxID=2487065 RepID=UPI000F4FC143|nr:hypothetical protein [Chryseobacterium sp. G0201]AZA55289.1 hypothetical protein EG348_20980 [Chryseobacterium sp. G0201]
MTIDQQKRTLTQIENLLKLNIEKKITEIYPDQSDIGNITINQMTIFDFISLLKKLLNQLLKEISSENRIILPFVYQSAEYGQNNLEANLINLQSQISNNQITNAENSLIWLAHYCLQNGFYDRSKYKTHSIDILKIEKQKSNLNVITENYIQLEDKYKTLLKTIEDSKQELDDFYNTKQSELQQISNNLTTSNSNNNQIQTLLNTSTESKAIINSLVEQIEKEKANTESLNSETAKKFNDLITGYTINFDELKKTKDKAKALNETFDTKLKFVENKTDYFEERNNYLDELIGREVGASLFETFKQRKIELNPSLNFWRWAVLILGGLTFMVVFAIFTNFFGWFGDIPTKFTWEIIAVNSLKSIPFFFLLYYTISQYNKERNFQEEYAFKSASALTIKAYSDILLNEENKDQLILKAVYNVYKSPVQQYIKGGKKDISNITDLLNEVVDKATEILKKKD